MRRIRPDQDVKPSLVYQGEEGGRQKSDLAVVFGSGNHEYESRCLRCPDEPCTTFGDTEGPMRQTEPVCPTSAIRAPRAEAGPSITDDCVGCGLCALRCPVGALRIEDGRAAVHEPGANPIYRPADSEEEFERSRDRLTTGIEWLPETSPSFDALIGSAGALRQDAFYPLVASLFKQAGIDVWRPARGDTSNRMDLVLICEGDAIPVEIKSRTESTVINVKSIQQALENKIILDCRAFLPSNPHSSTLVVGYDYPPERSDVTELISDISSAFDIHIGLVSIARLYALAVQRSHAGTAVEWSQLAELEGPL